MEAGSASPRTLAARDAADLAATRPPVAAAARAGAGAGSGAGAAPKQRKKRQRGARRPKPKPYSEMTWEEKLALEAEERRRAEAEAMRVRKPPRDERGRLRAEVALQDYAPPTPKHTTRVSRRVAAPRNR